MSLRKIGNLLGVSAMSVNRWIDEGLIASHLENGKPVLVRDYDPRSMTLLRIGVYASKIMCFTSQSTANLMRRVDASWKLAEEEGKGHHVIFIASREEENEHSYLLRCPPNMLDDFARTAAQDDNIDITGWDVVDVQVIHENTLQLMESLKTGEAGNNCFSLIARENIAEAA